MQDFWWRPTFLLSLLSLAVLAMGMVLGWVPALLLAILVLLVYLYRHLRDMSVLSAWLLAGDGAPLPAASNEWDELFYGLERMARRNKRSTARLMAVLDRFEHAAQAIPDGVIMLNEQGQIDWFNQIAAEHFDLNEAADRGQFITYLIRHSAFQDYLVRHDFREPLLMKSTGLRDTTLSVQMVAFGEQQKMLISRDVTQFEKVEAMRRDFVANVSHELRTPLTVVGGFLETFVDNHAMIGQPDFLHYCEMMLQQTDRMRRLVEDLLTLSRLESAQNRLVESVIDMRALVRFLYDDALTLSAGRHPITLVSDDDVDVLGNADELSSALGNLVSNAIRYTPSGKAIHLEWGWREQQMCFSVRDEGEGIEPHHIPRLTERFYRVDRGRSRETGGTGLGLAIVKHVLTRHQAKLLIESEVGKGSCFSACFPPERVVQQDAV